MADSAQSFIHSLVDIADVTCRISSPCLAAHQNHPSILTSAQPVFFQSFEAGIANAISSFVSRNNSSRGK